MGKPITFLVERWKLVAPLVLIVVCTISAAWHPTGLNVTGIVVGTIWLVLSLRGLLHDAPDTLRSGGLTPGMELEMNRVLVHKKNSAQATSGLPERESTPLEPPSSWQTNAEPPRQDLKKVSLGGREVFLRIMNGMKDQRGVHIESLLTCLGALAGYACQAAVREANVSAGAKSPESGLTVATGADGRKYFFGDPLNRPLAENRHSVWSLTAGAIQQLGKPLPNVEDIFKHVAGTVGGDQFGIPRLPDGHRAGDTPINFLKAVWPQILPIAQKFCDEPAHLPIVFGLAIQHAILMAKDVIDPTLAGTIAMESAVPMSKVDLG
jgi:hypothetical protein